ncbi:MAG: phosphoribosylformylglycinamidine cyclo-ligase [Senegalimassilia faecalis]
MSKQEVTYAASGVDIAEGARAVDAIKETVHSTYRPEVVGDIGGFGGLFSIAAAKDMAEPLLVSGTDGVGTKLKVAQLAGKHGTVGIDLVAMCVNDILACGAEPLFFLDYIAIGKLRREHVAEVVAGIGEGCRQAGCALIGGEMAEHPGVMDSDDYDLSGFTVGIVDKPKMLDSESVREGDVLIGLASSGLHSNGYSLARKVCVEGKSREELLAPVEALDGQSVADALLTPTRIYVKQVLGTLAACPGAVRALAHITGGGISENLNRALNERVDAQVDLGSWPVPAVAKYVCDAAELSEPQALKTFNMGVGMVFDRGPGTRRRGGGRAGRSRRADVPRRPYRSWQGRSNLYGRRQPLRFRGVNACDAQSAPAKARERESADKRNA